MNAHFTVSMLVVSTTVTCSSYLKNGVAEDSKGGKKNRTACRKSSVCWMHSGK